MALILLFVVQTSGRSTSQLADIYRQTDLTVVSAQETATLSKGTHVRSMRSLLVGTIFLLLGLLAVPAGALEHPDHTQPNRDSDPAGVDLGVDRGAPAGANGTIKIDGVEFDGTFDSHPNNEPHIGQCPFQVDFYGFEEGDTGVLRFSLWPPSGTKELIPVAGYRAVPAEGPFNGITDEPLAVSPDGLSLVLGSLDSDGAGGGIDIDGQYYVLLDIDPSLNPGAAGIHGYHIRAEAEITSGEHTYTKTKVFWVSEGCNSGSLS